jgi:hypothetical protein
MQAQPVHELAGQQDDPLVEEALAVLFTDQPERESVRPGDTRLHQQWMVRRAEGATSRAWLSFALPITSAEIARIKDRSETALRVAFVPRYVSDVAVTVQQTAINELTLTWRLVKSGAVVSEAAVLLTSGGG